MEVEERCGLVFAYHYLSGIFALLKFSDLGNRNHERLLYALGRT